MRKNMNLIPSLLLLNRHKQLWLWPSTFCTPRTLSFRATATDDDVVDPPNYRLLFNKVDDVVLLEPPEVELTTLGSLFTHSSSESASISTEEEEFDDCSTVETIVRGARSERLFFEPGSTSSILHETQAGSSSTTSQCEESSSAGGLAYKESTVAMVMESENPYVDFKKSMTEMVEIHELKDWDCLEELLGWYLKMNGKNSHGLIVKAFVDLLIAGFSGAGAGGGVSCLDHSTASSFTSVASTLSSPISSPLSHGN